MADCYFIGQGSAFDADMEFSKICVNYFNRGNDTDVSAFYHFYIGIAQKYFGEFETLYLSENLTEYIRNYSNRSELAMRGTAKNINEFKKHNSLDQVRIIFRDRVDVVENAYITKSDKLDEYIFDIFHILSKLLSFSDNFDSLSNVHLERSRKSNVNLGVIANTTGLFTFNSYMFAYVNGVHLVGVPTLPSEFDGLIGCSNMFLKHDLQHIARIIEKSKSQAKISQIYELIMMGNYAKQMKEILIFSLWFQVHETVRDTVKIYTYPYDFFYIPEKEDFFFFTEVFDHIDSEVRTYIIIHYEEIFGCLSRIDTDRDNYVSLYKDTVEDSFDTVTFIYNNGIGDDIKEYLEDASNDDDPELRLKIIYMYGCYLLFDLIKKVRE